MTLDVGLLLRCPYRARATGNIRDTSRARCGVAATGIFLGIFVTVTLPPRGDGSAGNSAKQRRGRQVPCQFGQRARRHTRTGRRSGVGGTSHKSVTKQSQKITVAATPQRAREVSRMFPVGLAR